MLDKIKLEDLRRAVMNSSMTQSEIAAELGISQAQVSRFLDGKRDLSFFTYAKLCNVIGHKAKDFLNDEGLLVLTSEI